MSGQTSRKTIARYVSILVDNHVDTFPANVTQAKEDTNRPIPKELLVKGIISPINFIGIAIGEVGYSFRQEKPIKPIPASQKKVISIVKASRLSLPIYFKGNQIWP